MKKKVFIGSLIAIGVAVGAFLIIGYGGESIKVGDPSELSNLEKKNDTTTLLGQVEKVVGNELNLKLSDDKMVIPEDSDEGADGQSYSLDEGQLGKLESGETLTMPDGTVITSDKDSNVSKDDKSTDGDKTDSTKGDTVKDKANFDSYTQLKFNGEYKDITISAGIEILNSVTGKKGKISDIKEGSIVTVTIDNKTNSVTKVNIVR